MQPPSRQSDAPEAGVVVRHRVTRFAEEWQIGEQPVPEAAWHDRALAMLFALLDCWQRRTGTSAAVFRDLAVRVQASDPRLGFAPDICLVLPAPEGARDLASLRLWEPGHAPPALVVEVVSPGHPYKDYTEVPDICGAIGVRELVVFDPMLVGPKAMGGPRRLQLWRRTDASTFDRTDFGDGPFFSELLGAHWISADDGRLLRLSDDEAGTRLWPTPEEAERAEKEAERAEKEAERAEKEVERAEKEVALRRVAELEARLRERGG